jgi:hypothetical protein
MAVRLRRKLRGADGGKHPHVKNAQDYTTPLPSHAVLCRQNAKTCYNILCGHVGKLDDSELEQRLTAALAALATIGGEER